MALDQQFKVHRLGQHSGRENRFSRRLTGGVTRQLSLETVRSTTDRCPWFCILTARPVNCNAQMPATLSDWV